jgi:porphobilinogen synthase
MPKRPRRLRRSPMIRDLIQETHLTQNDLIQPLFLLPDSKAKIEVTSMPGQYRLGIDHLVNESKELMDLGIKAICLFPACESAHKDPLASASKDPNHFYQKAIQRLKKECPQLLIMTDVAMDPYSSDGHDGFVNPETGEIENDKTVEILCEMARVQAESGADIIGPSDMMDGRIGAIREMLEADHELYRKILLLFLWALSRCSRFCSQIR